MIAGALVAACSDPPGAAVPVCGDGVVEGDEACDDGNLAFDDDCLPGCVAPTCGDGVVRSAPANPLAREECDGGGRTAWCDDDCTFAVCGDGWLNPLAGEVCDDGNTRSADGCRGDCRSDETCGNGILDDHLPKNATTNPSECLNAEVQGTGCAEACDDGNHVSGDGCSANCLSTEVCGNGIRDPEGNGSTNPPELCDDGNTNNDDLCANWCQSDAPGWICGDGTVYPGLEQCDPGGFADSAGCDWDHELGPQACTFARCGDGYVNAAADEQCDDANVIVTDDCVQCRLAACGDGALDLQPPSIEQCDLGPHNGTAGAPCSATCTWLAP